MANLCFLSYELFPVTPGGVGTLLYHSTRQLLERGHHVTLALYMAPELIQRFRREHLPGMPNAEQLDLVHIPALVGRIDDLRLEQLEVFQARAIELCTALRTLCRRQRVDMAEFFDYCGIAAEAVRRKLAEDEFAETLLAVRTHCTMDQLDGEQATQPLNLGRYGMYRMEAFALQNADVVLCPSAAWAAACRQRFGIDPSRIEISPGDFARTLPQVAADRPGADTVLFVGRLFQGKGIDLFVDAAVESLTRVPGRFRAAICGYDSQQSPAGGSYRDYLLERVPVSVRKRIEFLGQVDHERLAELLPRTACAVVPSYVESFCYAAHELYEAGVPVVLADIPAFGDFFVHEQNCLKARLCASDFAAQILRLLTDPVLRSRLAGTRPPRPPALGRAYDDDVITERLRRALPSSAAAVSASDGECRTSHLQAPSASEGISAREAIPSLALGACREGASMPSELPLGIPPAAANSPHVEVVIVGPAAPDLPAHPDWQRTLGCLPRERCRIWLLPEATAAEKEAGQAAVFLHAARRVYRLDEAAPEAASDPSCGAARAMVLQAGDTVHDDFWDIAAQVLDRPEIALVSAWQKVLGADGAALRMEIYPLDWLLWEYPFVHGSRLMRAIFPVQPGERILELFDPRAGRFGEWYRASAELSAGRRGYVIPRAFFSVRDQPVDWGSPGVRAFLYHNRPAPCARAGAMFAALLADWRLEAGTAGSMPADSVVTSEVADLREEVAWLKGSRILKLAKQLGLGPLAKPRVGARPANE